MSCGGGLGGCRGGSISSILSGGCGSSSISIPLGYGCSSRGRLHISRGACGNTSITVDSGGCGGTVPASNDDIVRAIEHIRNNRNI